MPDYFDLTPIGCQTPEGAKRVNDTLDEWGHIQAAVANTAASFVTEYEYELSLIPNAAEDLAELKARIREMNRLQDRFLRALAGRE
jgi:hypothetical protein